MTTAEFNKLNRELPQQKTEIHSNRYDDYAEHQIDVDGSKLDLLILVEDLNDLFDLDLRERDIQETGASCMLRFSVYEDF